MSLDRVRDERTLDELAEAGNARALFYRACKNIGKARKRAGRDHWNTTELAAWVARGRAAWGPSPRALAGRLTLVETMLEQGHDGEAICQELRRRAGTHTPSAPFPVYVGSDDDG